MRVSIKAGLIFASAVATATSAVAGFYSIRNIEMVNAGAETL